MKIPYTIQIDGTDNGGFIVKVGCRTLTFKNQENLLSALETYLENPEIVADGYAKTFGWSTDLVAPPVATAIQPAPAGGVTAREREVSRLRNIGPPEGCEVGSVAGGGLPPNPLEEGCEVGSVAGGGSR